MANLIKAIMYQTRRDKLLFVATAIFFLLSLLSFTDLETSTITGSEMFISCSASVPLYGYIPIFFVSRICGWDFQDKTINYEIMAGHSRREVYFSKVIVSAVLSFILYALLTTFPTLVMTIANGWGKTISIGECAERFLLTFLPLFRLSAFTALITFIIRNGYLSMIFGYIMTAVSFFAVIVSTELFEKDMGPLLSTTNINSLMTIDNFKLDFIDGEDVMVAVSVLKGSLVTETIVVSLVAGTICLFLGYLYFKKSDMK